MGPFRIVKNSNRKQPNKNYTVVDRWGDPVADVEQYEHGEAWIELYYKTRGLEQMFFTAAPTHYEVPTESICMQMSRADSCMLGGAP